MHKSQPSRISLRPATHNDCRQLWDWRNEATTRAASFDSTPIPYQDHESWFSRKITAEFSGIFIVIDSGACQVGYVRFNVEANEAEISISIDNAHRGKGYGTSAIRQASDNVLALNSIDQVIAYIKEDNPASISAFRAAGFTLLRTQELSGTSAYVMTYKGSV